MRHFLNLIFSSEKNALNDLKQVSSAFQNLLYISFKTFLGLSNHESVPTIQFIYRFQARSDINLSFAFGFFRWKSNLRAMLNMLLFLQYFVLFKAVEIKYKAL